MTLNITREQMFLDLNNHLTGSLKSMTCSCETSLEPDASYIEFRSWTNLKGEKTQLCIPGRVYIQAYNNHGTSRPLNWILEAEAKGNTTLLERIWKYIKDIN